MLNQRLAHLRKKNKLTQSQMADKIDVHRGTYSNYESGKREPDYETLQKMADFFEVSVDYLLGRTNDPDPDPQPSISFKGGEISPEEEEYLEEELKRFRKLKKRFQEQQQKDK